MNDSTDSGIIKAAKNVHEKAAETFPVLENTSYELTAQLDEDQQEKVHQQNF